ncbi:hypothetical protein BACCAP_04734 [Pseudoflavonifractor capillosus ATCC 29799]|uniref:Uncharacterized protein n=1 Tax=Pseudoflavonifractor capillosus ATCC 29799 TaxID=411467 RepID=A6P2K2_9FIRM|nr:hypothetical protein BACCAP_04734 [Pseudoflavonifractor capillosus ATCC 29799]
MAGRPITPGRLRIVTLLLDMTGSFFVPKTTSQSEFMEVNVWNFSIAQLILCRLS